MTAAGKPVVEALPLWAWIVIVLGCLIVIAICGLAGAAMVDRALAEDTDTEDVDQYADRELQQFECPHLEQAEIDRLRAVAAKQAAEARAPQPRGRI